MDPSLGYDPRRIARLLNALRELNRDPDPVRSVTRYAETMGTIAGDRGLISISMRGCPPGHYRVMRFYHQHGIENEVYVNIPFAGETAPVFSGGIIGEIIRREAPVVRRDLRVESDPVLGKQLAPYRFLLAIPVFGAGALLNWVLYLHTDPNAFTVAEIESSILQANLMSGITNAKRAMLELKAATEWIQREIDEVACLQAGLLPESLPDVPGLDIASGYATFDRAGGDFYDLFPLPETPEQCGGACRWGIMVADASGHGASAAVVIAMLAALLHSFPNPSYAPDALLKHLNQHLMRRQRGIFFVTAFFGVYDAADRSLTYATAGHNPPILREADGAVHSIQRTDGLPLGIDSATEYRTRRIRLQPGQSLVLYTDGITEAMNNRKELFGEERFLHAIAAADGSSETIRSAVRMALETHLNGTRPQDDQTLLVLRVLE